MNISNKTRRQLKIDNAVYLGLLLTIFILLAIISIRFPIHADWTHNNRNSLHQSSQAILAKMPDEIFISAFIGDDIKTRNAIRLLVSRYQYHKNNFNLKLIDPKKNPAQTRALGIQNNNEVIINYNNREERLQTLNEETFSNALQSLLRAKQHYIVFLTGHGERKDHKANHNISIFSQRLRDKGFNVQTLNLAETASIPDNTKLLVIANPQTTLLAGEINSIQHYVNQGGNLLWLTEPNSKNEISAVLPQLQVERLPGIIADYNAELSVNRRDYTLATLYPTHPITRNLGNITLFPQASGLNFKQNRSSKFNYDVFLHTAENSWTETDPQFSNNPSSARFNENSTEKTGPIVFGVAITRSLNEIEQRIAIIGDADFISNAYLGNAGNLELGLNIFNWLSQEDLLISIKPLRSADSQLQLNSAEIMFIAITFFLIIPIGLLSTGLTIWWKRKKQ